MKPAKTFVHELNILNKVLTAKANSNLIFKVELKIKKSPKINTGLRSRRVSERKSERDEPREKESLQLKSYPQKMQP